MNLRAAIQDICAGLSGAAFIAAVTFWADILTSLPR